MSDATTPEQDATDAGLLDNLTVEEQPGGASSSAFIHECEVCGLKVMLTSQIAFNLGWDYPPMMGEWGIVTPRTCGNCTIEKTLWWALAVDKKDISELTEQQKLTAIRIAKTERDEHPGATASGK